MRKNLVLFILVSLLSCHALAGEAPPIDVKFCDPLFLESGDWKYSNRQTLFEALSIEAEKASVRKLFAEELASFPFTALSEEEIVDALRSMVRRGESEAGVADPLSFCMILKKCRIDEADRARFKAVEIARVCHVNNDLVKKHAKKIKKSFIAALKEKEEDSKAPESALSMISDRDRIRSLPEKKLLGYLHEMDAEPSPDALDGVKCVSLVVYPIELYAASVRKEK